jgi:hypothetical protein
MSSDIGSYDTDGVFAVTERGVNAALKAYLFKLSKTSPIITVCFRVNSTTGQQDEQLDLSELQRLAKGADPFTIPSAGDARAAAIDNLVAAGFRMAFRARLGLPPNLTRHDKIIQFRTSDYTIVDFSIPLSEVTVVGLYFPAGGTAVVLSHAQSDVPFRINIPSSLTLQYVPNNPNMTGKVKGKLVDLLMNRTESVFSIGQLLLDLCIGIDTAVAPSITGFPDGPLQFLFRALFGQYVASTIEKQGSPILDCPIVARGPDSSRFQIQDFRLETRPYFDSSGKPTEDTGLASIQYFSVENSDVPKHLPETIRFTWNWVDKSLLSSCLGIFALSRTSFAGFIHEKLVAHVKRNCFQVNMWNVTFKRDCEPTIEFNEKGPGALRYTYDFKDHQQYSPKGQGEITTVIRYELTVTFTGSQILLCQRQTCNVDMRILATSGKSNVVDVQTDIKIDMAVDMNGRISLRSTEEVTNRSMRLPAASLGNSVTGFNETAERVFNQLGTFTLEQSEIPLGELSNFVMPGGKNWVYSNPVFSDNGDLMVLVNMVDCA